jgi:hypothetical protein
MLHLSDGVRFSVFLILCFQSASVYAFSLAGWSAHRPRLFQTIAAGQQRGLIPALRRRNKHGAVRMQWMDSDELAQPQWSAFKAYNMGRWKGRALHLSPETGDYIQPFTNDYVLDVVELEEGAQSAIQRLTAGDISAPRMSEITISANDDFACSDDGSYSVDRSLVSLSDVSGAVGETVRFCIEMSISVSEEERVRCSALYDFESKLSRIVLYEEQRVVSTGGRRPPSPKAAHPPAPIDRCQDLHPSNARPCAGVAAARDRTARSADRPPERSNRRRSGNRQNRP